MKSLRHLLHLMRPQIGWLVLGGFLTVLTLVANLSLMAISGWFLASMAIAGLAGVSMNYFTPAAIIRMTAILRSASRYAERLITHEATFRLITQIRVWFYQQLQNKSIVELNQYRYGDMLTRLHHDIQLLETFYLRFILPIGAALITTMIVLYVVYQYVPNFVMVMLWLYLLVAILLPLIIWYGSRKSGAELVSVQKNYRTDLLDYIQFRPELETSNMDEDFADALQRSESRMLALRKKQSRWTGLANAGLLAGTGISVWLVLWFVAPTVATGNITGPQLPMLMLFIMASFEALMPVPEALRLWPQIDIAVQRLLEITEQGAELVTDESEPPENFIWQMADVSFQYPDSNKLILKSIHLNLKVGQSLAIIGATGSGKSTITQLLTGALQPSAGAILLGEQDMNSYAQNQYIDYISSVPQKIYLFNRTVRDNLLLAYPQATDDAIWSALDVAELADRIRAMPEGLDTWLGETGVELSGGEMRRLGIARAILKPHKLLILDEPLAGLDANLAKAILKNLFETKSERALLMISHQQLGLDYFDQISLLEEGELSPRKKTH